MAQKELYLKIKDSTHMPYYVLCAIINFVCIRKYQGFNHFYLSEQFCQPLPKKLYIGYLIPEKSQITTHFFNLLFSTPLLSLLKFECWMLKLENNLSTSDYFQYLMHSNYSGLCKTNMFVWLMPLTAKIWRGFDSQKSILSDFNATST